MKLDSLLSCSSFSVWLLSKVAVDYSLIELVILISYLTYLIIRLHNPVSLSYSDSLYLIILIFDIFIIIPLIKTAIYIFLYLDIDIIIYMLRYIGMLLSIGLCNFIIYKDI